MTSAIPPEYAVYVTDGIASGRFRSEEEAVREGLRLLQTQDQRVAALRDDLRQGIDDLESGDRTPLDAVDIKRRGRERLNTGSA